MKPLLKNPTYGQRNKRRRAKLCHHCQQQPFSSQCWGVLPLTLITKLGCIVENYKYCNALNRYLHCFPHPSIPVFLQGKFSLPL